MWNCISPYKRAIPAYFTEAAQIFFRETQNTMEIATWLILVVFVDWSKLIVDDKILNVKSVFLKICFNQVLEKKESF